MPTKKPAKQIDIADFLNQQHLCESLTLNEVKTLMEFTEPVFFKKNEVIADIGEVGEALFFIIKGEVALFFENHSKDVEIGRLKEGEVMGEMSFFDRQARSARIRASAGDTRLLKLTRTLYNRLRVEHPFIAVNLLEHAIISLDHLFRRLSLDIASFNQYMYGNGPIRQPLLKSGYERGGRRDAEAQSFVNWARRPVSTTDLSGQHDGKSCSHTQLNTPSFTKE